MDGEVYQLESRKKGQCRFGRRVILADDVVIPPRSQMDVNTKVVFDGLFVNKGAMSSVLKDTVDARNWGTQPQEVEHGLLVARTLLPDRVQDLPVRMMNTSGAPVTLQRNTVVSELEPLQPVVNNESRSEQSAPEEDRIIGEMMQKVDSSVPDHINSRLKSMLQRYSCVLSKDEWDLGWTDIVTHRIDVGDSKPIRQQCGAIHSTYASHRSTSPRHAKAKHHRTV